MKKASTILFLLALFIGASAATTVNVSSSSISQVKKPELAFNLKLIQTGPGTVLASWSVTLGGGPFLVTVFDMTTNQRVQVINTNQTFAVINNLVAGHTYLVTVGDLNDASITAAQITVH